MRECRNGNAKKSDSASSNADNVKVKNKAFIVTEEKVQVFVILFTTIDF